MSSFPGIASDTDISNNTSDSISNGMLNGMPNDISNNTFNISNIKTNIVNIIFGNTFESVSYLFKCILLIRPVEISKIEYFSQLKASYSIGMILFIPLLIRNIITHKIRHKFKMANILNFIIANRVYYDAISLFIYTFSHCIYRIISLMLGTVHNSKEVLIFIFTHLYMLPIFLTVYVRNNVYYLYVIFIIYLIVIVFMTYYIYMVYFIEIHKYKGRVWQYIIILGIYGSICISCISILNIYQSLQEYVEKNIITKYHKKYLKNA